MNEFGLCHTYVASGGPAVWKLPVILNACTAGIISLLTHSCTSVALALLCIPN